MGASEESKNIPKPRKLVTIRVVLRSLCHNAVRTLSFHSRRTHCCHKRSVFGLPEASTVLSGMDYRVSSIKTTDGIVSEYPQIAGSSMFTPPASRIKTEQFGSSVSRAARTRPAVYNGVIEAEIDEIKDLLLHLAMRSVGVTSSFSYIKRYRATHQRQYSRRTCLKLVLVRRWALSEDCRRLASQLLNL
jgi:hypothetical protein